MNAMMKLFVKTHTILYRMTGGKIGGSMQGATVMILTTTGRKTGQPRSIPLMFMPDDVGNPVIVASAAGAPVNPAWFENLKANPDVTYQVGARVLKARADIANPELRKQLWERLVSKYKGYAEYQKKTDRVIPIVTLKPVN